MSQDNPPPPQAALIGRRWDGGEHLVTAADIAAFAQATDDTNPRYAGDAPVAPPMFHVRLMRDLLFLIIEDPALTSTFCASFTASTTRASPACSAPGSASAWPGSF
ncbi:MAG: MaoC family dehydratase N-terminal domain-containing protein [Deltaproteobacteria bacterium]|nr:MaoC family dehydratase N-terminal domain-containing protein [Deltaproteobacteria bacterium]